VIGYVTADSPAAKAGLQAGDLIIQMDDQKGPNWEDIALKEMTSAAKPLKIVVQRGNEHVETTVVPVLNERTGVGSAGWAERGEVQLGTITPGMPAEKAGLKKGDIIAAVNGQPIHSATRFHE
jgi:regulator of sigma E protease